MGTATLEVKEAPRQAFSIESGKQQVKKTIFLDFDGIILPIPAGGKREPDLELSTEAVANANILVQVSGARVVVTSSWRIGRSVAELTKLLKSWGCKFFVYDKIPSDDDEDRGGDILAWLGDDAALHAAFRHSSAGSAWFTRSATMFDQLSNAVLTSGQFLGRVTTPPSMPPSATPAPAAPGSPGDD